MSVVLSEVPQSHPTEHHDPVSVSPKSYNNIFPLSPSFNGQSHNLAYSQIDIESNSCQIPTIIVQCFDKIFENTSVEGIFRINGSVKRIGHIYNHLLNNEGFDTITEYYNCHDVCGVLKKFLKIYLPQISEIFSPNYLFFDKFKTFYDEYMNIDSTSMSSYKTALTSQDSQPLTELLNSFTKFIILKNSSFKNNLFIYFLFNINKLCKYQSTTKMTSLNYSIIFQPYLFNSSNLSYLPFLQEFLHLLIDNFDLLLESYELNHLQTDNDDYSSVNSIESINISPITDNSHMDSIFDKNAAAIAKRNSVTSKFSNFLENYYTPTNKKRFSLSFHLEKKEDRLHDHDSHFRVHDDDHFKENQFKVHNIHDHDSRASSISSGGHYLPEQLTKQSSIVKSSEFLFMTRNSSVDKSKENLAFKNSKHDVDNSIDSSIKKSRESLFDSNPKVNSSTPATTQTNLDIEYPSSVNAKKSKRKSFISLFKSSANNSSLSIGSKKLNNTPTATSATNATTSTKNKHKSPYSNLNNSLDDILMTKKHDTLLHPEQKSLLNRNFSLRIKAKKF